MWSTVAKVFSRQIIVSQAGCQIPRNFSRTSIHSPKRPPGQYIIFSKEKFAGIRQENPALNTPEIARITASLWRTMSENEKQAYKDQAEQLKAAYLEERERFLDTLSAEDKKNMEDEATAKRKQRAARKVKRQAQELGKPSRGATSGFACFVKGSPMEKWDAHVTIVMKGLAQTWQNMTAQDKQKYEEMAKQNKAEYEEKLLEWEARMIELGHNHLVRGYKKPTKRKPKRKPKKKVAKKVAKKTTKKAASKRKSTTSKKSKATQTTTSKKTKTTQTEE